MWQARFWPKAPLWGRLAHSTPQLHLTRGLVSQRSDLVTTKRRFSFTRRRFVNLKRRLVFYHALLRTQHVEARSRIEIADVGNTARQRPQPAGTQAELDAVVGIDEPEKAVDGDETFVPRMPLKGFDGATGLLDAEQFVHHAGRLAKRLQQAFIQP